MKCHVCGQGEIPACRTRTCSAECWWKLDQLYNAAPAMFAALNRIRDAAGRATDADVDVSPLGFVQTLGAIAECALDAIPAAGCLTIWSDDVVRLFTVYSPIIRADPMQARMDANIERMDAEKRGSICSSWLDSPPTLSTVPA